jgi:hypothetical protein
MLHLKGRPEPADPPALRTVGEATPGTSFRNYFVSNAFPAEGTEEPPVSTPKVSSGIPGIRRGFPSNSPPGVEGRRPDLEGRRISLSLHGLSCPRLGPAPGMFRGPRGTAPRTLPSRDEQNQNGSLFKANPREVAPCP